MINRLLREASLALQLSAENIHPSQSPGLAVVGKSLLLDGTYTPPSGVSLQALKAGGASITSFISYTFGLNQTLMACFWKFWKPS